MPQIEILQCPSCGANASYDGGPETTITCQFCGTPIIVPEELRPKAAPAPAPAPGDEQASLQALDESGYAEVLRLAKNGQKIEAIKLYRQLTNADLSMAKAAVDAMAGVRQRQTVKPVSNSINCAGVIIGILVAVLICGFVGAMVGGVPFRMSGSYKQALEAAQADPQVNQALGEPIEASWLPISGEISCGGSCSANYDIPIHGSHGSGRIWVTSNSKGAGLFNEGVWTLDAQVYVDNGPTIPLSQAKGTSSGEVVAAPTAAPMATSAPMATPTSVPTSTPKPTLDETVAANATATQEALKTGESLANAKATAQVMETIQANWQPAITDSFMDNRLGWPTGIQQDAYISINTQIKDGAYLTSLSPKQNNSYMNILPAEEKSFSDIYAAVTIRSFTGGDGGDYAAGLIFHHVNNDYAFFGLQNNGDYRIMVVYDSGIYTLIVNSSPAIKKGEPNRLAVRAIGSDFIFLINDQAVWSLSEEMAEGGVGMGVDVTQKGGKAQVEFTDFEVRAP